MLNELTQDQLGQLQQHLIVPLAIADILHHDLDVEADMQYGLHMALSEVDPDSALLAIALCAQDLASKCLIRAPIAAALQQEANNIIEEYGAVWLHHHQKGPMTSEQFEKVLQNVPEDLEAMADLIDALCADLDETESSTVTIGNLLSIQARAHMEIADYILTEIEYERTVGESGSEGGMAQPQIPTPLAEPLDMDAYKGSNIVLFPTNLRH